MKTLSATGYEIVRDAVNISRTSQCKSLKVLELHLKKRWPGKNQEITEAIQFWSFCLNEHKPCGVVRP